MTVARRALNVLALAAIALYAALVIATPWENDAYAYWRAWSVGLYTGDFGTFGSYLYSPAFAMVLWPATLLPFGIFWAGWTILQAGALVAIAGPVLALLLIALPWLPAAGWTNPAVGSIEGGNITILLAVVAAFGLRYPALWAFALLTKVTPGIGILWFAVRREWPKLGIALGVTAVIAGVSFAIAPDLWFRWAGVLAAAPSIDPAHMEPLMPFRVAVRLPVAAGVIAWGAWKDQPWTVPVGVFLAQPDVGVGGYIVLAAVVPYLRR